MRIYIAGPITGMPGWNRQEFERAARALRGTGAVVVSPIEMGEKYGTEEEIEADIEKLNALISEELAALAACDAIYLLPGWQRSKGTLKELQLALALGLEVMVQKEGKE